MANTLDRWFLRTLFGTALVGQAVCATAPAALQISAETAPASGWTQIKIYATKPMAIASGHLAGLPVMVCSVPGLASASGRTGSVSATSPDSSVSVASGSVTVRGTLSV